MDRLVLDALQSLRRLLRTPSFTIVAVLTLALGIGATTAIFSVVRAVLLDPLPYRDADGLVMLWGKREKGEVTWLSTPEATSYASDSRAFSGVATYYATSGNLTGGDEPERVFSAAVSTNLFATLGVAPLLGRGFAAADSATSIVNEVVLSHGLWQRRFGARTDIIGESIRLNGDLRNVVGVMPPTFRLPLDFASERPSELWVPMDSRFLPQGFGNHSLIGFARLAPGITLGQATTEMHRLEEKWVADGNWQNRDLGGRQAVPMRDLIVGDVRAALWVLFGAVGAILLIACANVANLMLARLDDRQREIAVRSAMGASRRSIARLLLTESLVLSTIGGVLGVALAYGGVGALVALRPAGVPRVAAAEIDLGVMLFAFAVTIATGLLFGIAPALEHSRSDLNRTLKEGGRGNTLGRSRLRFRDSLAVAQMAFSVVLLIGAVLLARSFVELRSVDLGFRTEAALTARVVLPTATYETQTEVVDRVRELRQRIADLPNVQVAGATRLLPLTGTIGDWSITIENRPSAPGENPNGDWQVVTPGYFEAMGMRLVRGRFFAETDAPNTPIVAVINETMANRYWPGEDAIGKRFRLGTDQRPWITIVGLVGRVQHNTVTETSRAEMYVPHAQWPVATGGAVSRGMTYVIRTAGDPLAVLPHLRATVRSLDPSLPLSDVRTLEQVADNSLAQARFTTFLLGLFAALALALAAIGIYGVIALLVARRRQEIGIRIALGARRGSILGMVVGRGLTLAGIGTVTGLAVAAILTRLINSMLYGVTPLDIVTFLLVPAILVTVAAVACLVPAGRAMAVDPAVALRD